MSTTTLDDLLTYLRKMEGHHAPPQPCKERLVLAHARAFGSQLLTRNEHELLERHAASLKMGLSGFEPKQCFWNAQQLVTAGPDGHLAYVEGYVFRKDGIPTHHGWLTINGSVVDLTLRDRATGDPILGTFVDRVYFGISFETRFVRTEMFRTNSATAFLEDATGLKVGGAGSVRGVLRERW